MPHLCKLQRKDSDLVPQPALTPVLVHPLNHSDDVSLRANETKK